MRNRLTLNALILLGSDGGSRLLTFIANVHLARLLDTENYGIIFLGLTILSYAMWGADLGLATLGTREMAKPAADREFTLADIFSLKTILGIAAVIVTGLLVLFVVRDTTTRVVTWIFLTALLPSFWQLEWYYQGVRRYGAVALVRYLFGIGYLAGVWFLVDSPDDVYAVPLIYTGALVLAAAAALIMRRKKDPLLPRRTMFGGEQMEQWRYALKRSLPIGFGGGMMQTVQLLPPIVIAAMYDEAEVGLFGAAFRLAVNLMIFDRAFLALFLPAMSNLLITEPERSPNVLRRTFRLLLSSGIILSLLITLFSGVIMKLIYGPAYAGAVAPLAIMSWYVVATLMNSFFSSVLVAAGIEKSYLHSSLISSLLGGILMLVLTWFYGIVGASIGVTACEGIMAILMYFSFRKHIGIPLLLPASDTSTKKNQT